MRPSDAPGAAGEQRAAAAAASGSVISRGRARLPCGAETAAGALRPPAARGRRPVAENSFR